MGIFSRSKESKTAPPPPSSPPRPSKDRPAQIPYPPVAPQQPVFQNSLGSPPIYNPYEQLQPGQHGRSQSYPPPQGWAMGPPAGFQPYQQVIVSNYLLPAPPMPIQPLPIEAGKKNKKSSPKLRSKSSSHLPKILQGDMPSFIPGAHYFNEGAEAWHQQMQTLPVPAFVMPNATGGPTLYDLISTKFDAVITGIDGESFSGDERELYVYQPQIQPQQEGQWLGPNDWQGHGQGMVESRALVFGNGTGKEKAKPAKVPTKNEGCAITTAFASMNYFSKVDLYANSRLPAVLPSVRMYISTFPLICIAAQYSERVYARPTGSELEAHVPSSWALGTKAMTIKSIPMDSANLLVFAIRGSQTFLDWAVNLNSAPSPPMNFLDDPGNLCHTGFLSVARKMVKPVAERLKALLKEDPGRRRCSLLVTGHSAGGAVASLLYMHMLSTSPETRSELNLLTSSFRRIHCITFGAPPVSLLPLTKPKDHALKKSLFLGFVNEGDPVTRADKAYIRGLLNLYSSPAPVILAPEQPGQSKNPIGNNAAASKSRLLLLPAAKASKSSTALVPTHKTDKPTLRPPSKSSSTPSPLLRDTRPIWPVPPCTLSNAGRLILLRAVPVDGARKDGKDKKGAKLTMDDGVQAMSITDEDLRGVVFGDPVCHMMKLYKRRVDVLATNAVVGG